MVTENKKKAVQQKETVKAENKTKKTAAANTDTKINIKENNIKENTLFDPYRIIKRPLSTEKSIRQIEFENKLTFIVDAKACKPEIKRAVEELFKVKVIKVNLQNSFRGDKRATVKLSAGNLASDVSAELGLI